MIIAKIVIGIICIMLLLISWQLCIALIHSIPNNPLTNAQELRQNLSAIVHVIFLMLTAITILTIASWKP